VKYKDKMKYNWEGWDILSSSHLKYNSSLAGQILNSKDEVNFNFFINCK
jgi:hypothetical protein